MSEGCTGSLGRSLCQDPQSPGLISLIPWSVASRPMVLNFDQSQTYLRSSMWNPLGAAVFAGADCGIGSSTALCLAAAASDRAGSLDSNSIIISPFKSSAFFRDYAQQWNFTSSMGGDSLRVCSRSCTSMSFFLSLSRCLSSLWSLSSPPPPPLPLCTGFWPRACHFTEADFPRLPKGYFTRIPIRSLPITNVPNHLQKNLFTLCGNGFIWLAQKKPNL